MCIYTFEWIKCIRMYEISYYNIWKWKSDTCDEINMSIVFKFYYKAPIFIKARVGNWTPNDSTMRKLGNYLNFANQL